MRASLYPVPRRLPSAPCGAEAAEGGLWPPRLVEEHKEVMHLRQQMEDILSRQK
jgi:hypothetical protein